MKPLAAIFLSLILCTMHVSSQPVSLHPVIDVFEVMKEHSLLSPQGFWPGFSIRKIPVAVYDSANTWLFFTPVTPEGFQAIDTIPGVFIYNGQHPLVRGNSMVRIGDRWIATSVLTGSSRRTGEKYSARDLAGIIIHEQFHVFQRTRHPSWRQNDGLLLFYPDETPKSLELRRAEKAAFRRAVTSADHKEMAGWAMTGLNYRYERLGGQDVGFWNYEKILQLSEGLSDYVEKVARGLDPLNSSEITSGIAPAGVRDLGYVEGRWIALILDQLGGEWKALLEECDTLYLEDILKSQIGKLPVVPEGFTPAEIEAIRNQAACDLKKWQEDKVEEIRRYTLSPGYQLDIVSSAYPLNIRIFQPLEIELLAGGDVYHRLIFSAANDRAGIRIADHPCITHFDDAYRLVKTSIYGLREKPVISDEKHTLTLKYDRIVIELTYSGIEVNGEKMIVRL